MVLVQNLCGIAGATSHMGHQFGKAVNSRLAAFIDWWRFVPQDQESRATILAGWSEESGDCRQGLVFIGQHIDFERLGSELDACLLTDRKWRWASMAGANCPTHSMPGRWLRPEARRCRCGVYSGVARPCGLACRMRWAGTRSCLSRYSAKAGE